jgi:hypothetical protein
LDLGTCHPSRAEKGLKDWAKDTITLLTSNTSYNRNELEDGREFFIPQAISPKSQLLTEHRVRQSICRKVAPCTVFTFWVFTQKKTMSPGLNL